MCYDLIMLWLTLVCCQQLAEPPPVFYQAPESGDAVSWLQATGAMSVLVGSSPSMGFVFGTGLRSHCLETSLWNHTVNLAYAPTFQGTVMEQSVEDVCMVIFMCSDLCL